MHLSAGWVKFLVMLVSFLVQLQSHYGSLEVEFVTFLHVQFYSWELPSHLYVLLG